MICVLVGVCCLVVLFVLAFHRRRKPDNGSNSLSSPSPPTETASGSRSAGGINNSGSSVSSNERHLAIGQWQPHDLEAGKTVPVDVDVQRQLGSSSMSSSGLSERSIYHTASGTMVFVHD